MLAIGQPLVINQIPDMYNPPSRYVDSAVACASPPCSHIPPGTIREGLGNYLR
jgi:hypothetical protein